MDPADFRSDCPIASTLDLVGDRWSLLILRDMLFGASTFSDFAARAERIPRNILAERLKRLEAAGIVTRQKYQDRPERFRYLLTQRGADLVPVVQALAVWGAAHLPHVYAPPESLLAMRPNERPHDSGH